LVPFRIFAAGLPVVFAFFIIKAATLFENLNKKYIENPESEHYGKPVHRIPKSKWRRKIIECVTRLASKITLVFGLGFYDVKVTDLRKKDENGKPITSPLIIANHSSLVDVLAIFAYYDSCPSFLAMNWVKKTPFVSGVADGLQCIYVEPDRKQGLTKQIQAIMIERGEMVATAESLTGGMVASSIVYNAGSSAIMAGGIVAYQNEIKEKLLGVPHEILAEKGPVNA